MSSGGGFSDLKRLVSDRDAVTTPEPAFGRPTSATGSGSGSGSGPSSALGRRPSSAVSDTSDSSVATTATAGGAAAVTVGFSFLDRVSPTSAMFGAPTIRNQYGPPRTFHHSTVPTPI
jgi:hypothetical protein